MDSLQFDFLVIGSGLAGLSFALEASQTGTVCILTKNSMTESNTSWAQGGIAAAIGESDSWQAHERDTLIAGDGLCDQEAVRYLVTQAPEGIEWLERYGVRFDTGDDGNFRLGREGGHSLNRIVHHQDRTGWEVERAISEAVASNEAISIFEHAYVDSLLMSHGRCIGARAQIDTLGERLIHAKAVFLATGGCGRLYTHTTNPTVATGDGVALASEAGAAIANMEFMQFHPTTLYHPQQRSFLISEAVRGAGGTLKNHLGSRFMYDYDDRLELAPRDVVARAIDAEMRKHETWCVYLDTTHLTPERLMEEFPTIYERLASIDIRMERDWIPVVPAQHYSCGGVVTNLDGQTSVEGLFAGGECTCTGVHGANRLASNSLLEALVFSRSAAKAASALLREPVATSDWELASSPKSIAESDAIRLRKRLQRLMTKYAWIVRRTSELKEAQRQLRTLRNDYNACPEAPFSAYSLETSNLITVAGHVITGALARSSNVGLHYNVDLKRESESEFSKVPV